MTSGIEVKGLAQSQGGMWPSSILFENISFRWDCPGLHVIMGSSGGGKSTFLKSIGGVWPPLQGSVSINQIPLWNLDTSTQNPEALKDIGFAFQNNVLFSSLRNLENLSFPHSQKYPDMSAKERQELSMHWLQKVGLESSAMSFPHELSGGMQKRLAIARTLILNPKFIFLDDPTAGLDPITSEAMGELLNGLLQSTNSLVILVTNDVDRAKDWGPQIHFLFDRTLISPNSPRYADTKEHFID